MLLALEHPWSPGSSAPRSFARDPFENFCGPLSHCRAMAPGGPKFTVHVLEEDHVCIQYLGINDVFKTNNGHAAGVANCLVQIRERFLKDFSLD
jgi:hypothetical protein